MRAGMSCCIFCVTLICSMQAGCKWLKEFSCCPLGNFCNPLLRLSRPICKWCRFWVSMKFTSHYLFAIKCLNLKCKNSSKHSAFMSVSWGSFVSLFLLKTWVTASFSFSVSCDSLHGVNSVLSSIPCSIWKATLWSEVWLCWMTSRSSCSVFILSLDFHGLFTDRNKIPLPSHMMWYQIKHCHFFLLTLTICK